MPWVFSFLKMEIIKCVLTRESHEQICALYGEHATVGFRVS